MRNLAGGLVLLLAASTHAVCGDVDADGAIMVLDALQIAQASAGVITLSPSALLDADADDDGSVTILDALIVSQAAAGLPATLLCSCPTPPAQTPGNPYSPSRLAWMADMAGIASTSIARVDVPSYAVFHGSVDWHSAVHSHWMLIRHAQATGDTTHDAQVQASLLRPGGIDAEATLLRSQPFFEMPYGRAWFLRLVIDYEIHFSDPVSLRSMGDEVFASMDAHYSLSPPSPLLADYSNASWAFTQMIAYAQHKGDWLAVSRLSDIVATAFDTASAQSLNFDNDLLVVEFFSRFGNWLHLVATASCDSVFLAAESARAVPTMNLSPKVAISGFTGHDLGLNPSRAWALTDLARLTGDPVYASAWEDHMIQMEAHHNTYAGDYIRYDHWVPSFNMYALTRPLQ